MRFEPQDCLTLVVVALESRGRAFAQALQKAGHVVLEARTADEVESTVGRDDVDGVFVCGAPAECAARVRELRRGHELLSSPILRVGYEEGPAARAEAFRVGLDGYVEASDEPEVTAARAERGLASALARRRRVGLQFMAAVVDVVCVIDGLGNFVDLSPSCETVLGYRPDELAGLPYLANCHPEDVARTLSEVQAIMGGKASRGFENRYIRKNGDIVHLLWSEHWSGPAGRLYIVARDVTERRTKLARYESFFELSSELLAVLDFEGRIKQHNRAFGNLFAPDGESLVARFAFDLVSDEDRTRGIASFRDGLTGIRNPSLEVHMRSASGAQRLIAWSGRILIDERLVYAVGRDVTESRTVAERLRGTLEGMSDAFFAFDREWRLTFVNSVFERNIRKSREELVGRVIFEFMPALLANEVLPHYRRAVETGEPVHFEYFAAQTQSYFEVHLYPTAHDIGVYYRDVTERRVVDDALRDSEERLRFLSRATSEAIWDWHIESGLVWRSEGFGRMFGFETDMRHMTEAFWTDRLHPDDRERMMAALAGIMSSNAETFGSEYRFLRGDGTWIWVQDRGYVIRDADGRPLRMIGGMIDISERRANEDRLAAQAALLDSARDAILVRAFDGEITYWNRGAERIYGWSAGEASGRHIRDLICLEPANYEAANRRLRTHGEWTGETAQKTKEGREILVDARWTLITDREGREQVLVINTDITERRKLEQQFLRAQRMESIGTLAGGIAHDLNNILAPVLMSVDLLRSMTTDPESLEVLDAIGASAHRGAELVRQVLGFARGVSGERVILDPRSVVTEVRKILLEALPKTIRFECDMRGHWLVRADPTQLHQVLMNLCINARDAMPHGGVLKIALEDRSIDDVRQLEAEARMGAFLQISVSDTGHGMTTEVLSRIFDPFFTTKPVGSGTGLGLPTVQAIVKSHRGWINVRSEAGRGSVFTVNLPAEPSAPALVQPHEGRGPRPRGAGELVIIVDDEAAIRKVAQQTLEVAGYRVAAAQDGADGVALVIEHLSSVALVITDMMMPVMDGAAMIKALRRLAPRVPIIATSGVSSNGNAAVASGLGVQAFLEKPFTGDTLLACVASVLAASREAAAP